MTRLAMLLLALGFALPVLSAPCRAKPLDVVASFTVLADVVREIGGDAVAVRSLVPIGGDPHEYEPTPDDAKALLTADAVFLSGLGLEPWFARLAKASGFRGMPIAVSATVSSLQFEDDGRRQDDPHVWNDPRNVVRWTSAIADALSAADPSHRSDFQTNAARYISALTEADADARKTFAATPAQRRKVLTSHDGFAYFARAYDITVLSPTGISTASEPSAKGLAALIDQIRREGIRTYFVEASNNPRLVKQVAAATGAKPGGTLYVESLSAGDGPAVTYLAMFRANVALIAAAMRE